MMEYKRLTERSKNGFVHYKCSKKDMKDCGLYYNCGECHKSTEALYRLAELEDKIENGTLIELPCKIGDKVWCVSLVWDFDGNFKGDLYEAKANGFYIENGIIQIEDDIVYEQHNFGVDVFLTREEAEKRLKEIQE